MRDLEDELIALISADSWRLACLAALRDVMGSEGWVAAGFIRNMIWDRLQGLAPRRLDDVDVVYFDPADLDEATEKQWDRRLASALPGVPWSAKNQVRMALRNGDGPYRDVRDALYHYLETATGVAARMTDDNKVEILAAHGLEDLFAMVLRPTPAGLARREQLEARIVSKGWLERWPDLKIVGLEAPSV